MLNGLDDGLDFFVGECRVAGQAQLLTVYLLGDGERKGIPLGITSLLVGWNGVVYHGLYALFGKIGLQEVSAWAENGEEVIDILAFVFAGPRRNQDVLA